MGIPRVAVIGIIGVVLAAAAFLFTRPPAEPAAPPAAVPAAAVPTQASKPTTPVSDSAAKADDNPADNVPADVAKALDDGKVVVLMFAQAGGADDKATRSAVRGLEGAGSSELKGHFQVFTDGVAHLVDYAAVIGDLGIDQAPATVIVAPDGEARVVQGFVDERSLLQYVADALG
ncbi:MAG: hypothetical protein QOG62_2392 [Thermoleophilaceae bacterium]|jgi:hypothetical protein|nr:hypothetical protein [Thermoleophilaceae bacterium]